LEPDLKARALKQERTVRKPGSKTKAGPSTPKAGEAELAKERRRAGQVARQGDAAVWSAAKRKTTAFVWAIRPLRRACDA